MRKLVLVPGVAFALAACTERTEPLATSLGDTRASLQSATIWFASTPPVPAAAGAVYEVVVKTIGSPISLESSNPWICLPATSFGFGTLQTEVLLYDVGTCTLRASEFDYRGEAFQSFEIVRVWSSEVMEGSAVVVQPSDHMGDSPVTLTFESVTSAGSVSLSTETVDHTTDPQPPANFQLGDPPTYYDITVSDGLTFDGLVRVCIQYTAQQFANVTESDLQLLHWDGSAWKVLPNQKVDPEAMTVCADTDSFSPFAIAYPTSQENGKRKAKAKGRSQD